MYSEGVRLTFKGVSEGMKEIFRNLPLESSIKEALKVLVSPLFTSIEQLSINSRFIGNGPDVSNPGIKIHLIIPKVWTIILQTDTDIQSCRVNQSCV